MKDRFDLEQDIMLCWSVVDDVDLLMESVVDNPKYAAVPAKSVDDISNALMGIKELYNLRFERLWETFLQSHNLNEYGISGKSDSHWSWDPVSDE